MRTLPGSESTLARSGLYLNFVRELLTNAYHYGRDNGIPSRILSATGRPSISAGLNLHLFRASNNGAINSSSGACTTSISASWPSAVIIPEAIISFCACFSTTSAGNCGFTLLIAYGGVSVAELGYDPLDDAPFVDADRIGAY